MVYEVISRYNGDEFSEGIYTDKQEAIDTANWAYNRGDLARKRRTVVEVRIYADEAYKAAVEEYGCYMGDYDTAGVIDGIALNGASYSIE